NSIKIQSELLLRFMDDFYLFSDNEKKINSDFIIIQKILGEKGLSLNSAKTLYGNLSNQEVQTIDDIKVGLLQLRRQIIDVSGFPSEDLEEDEDELLTDDQIEYLLDLLKEPDIDESNAELVLVLLHDNENEVLEKMDTFLKNFPSLSRNIYNFCRDVSDVDTLSDLLLQFLKNGTNATEDQLFWIAKISEDLLSKTPKYADILSSLYDHPNATVISRAKVIEIPENRFGMGELRREHLRVGKSDWLAWASAVGCRSETPISRNHTLSYFSKASPMNKLVADCVKNLPERY
ncbi:orotate phosphoribosyltransferase, partial [Gloeocapsa sp. BRSZ]